MGKARAKPVQEIHPELLAQAREAEQWYPGYVISLFDSSGNYRYVSVEPIPVRGYMREDLYGHHYSEFTVKQDLAHLRLAINDTDLHGESVEIGVVVKCKDGGTTYLRVSSWKVIDPDTGEEFHMSKSRIMPEHAK